ncbi:MAG TPA: GNAT family protein [Nannocystaceae bacterium]|nr:GNAT family protein [Nannocystaceae bacterium]
MILGDIPAIETARLSLRSMGTQLLAALAAGRVDAAQALVDYEIPVDFSLLRKAAMITHRLALIEADPSQHPWMYRAIVSKRDGRLVGHISFHHKAPDPDVRAYVQNGAELGYGIEAAYRRRGFAKESAIAMMTWAADRFDVRSFVLSISPRNVPSLKLAESMGFEAIAEHRDPVDGPELVMRVDIDRVVRPP